MPSTQRSDRGIRQRPAVRSLLAALTLTVVAGCDAESEAPPRASVSGVVYVGSEELKSGIARFVPIDGTKGPIVTASVADGYFSLAAENGPTVGKHRVEILATDFLSFDLGDQAAAEQAMRGPAGRSPRNPVPPGYGGRSPLTAEVPSEGAEGLVFILTANVRGTSERPRSGAFGFAATTVAR